MQIDDPDDIIGFKRPSRSTNVDYRSQLALDANGVLELRRLCGHIDDEHDFQWQVVCMLKILSMLNKNATNNEEDTSFNNWFNTHMNTSYSMTTETESEEQSSSLSIDSNCSSSSSFGTLSSDDDPYFNVDIMSREVLNQHYDNATKIDYAGTINVFSSILGCSVVDLDTFCQSLIDLTAITRAEWNNVQVTNNSPKKNRTIAELGDTNCYNFTRFRASELIVLYNLLFSGRRSDKYTFKKCTFTYEETLLISLHYMANGTKYNEMKEVYGGDWTRYSYMVNFFARYLYHKFYHRLMGRSMEYFNRDVPDCRNAIWNYVCFDSEGEQDVNVPFDRFRPFGFIDCMTTQTSRPGSGPRNEEQEREDDAYAIQRAFFTSYGKKRGMKTQAIYLPNGMVSHVFFTSIA